MPLRDILLYAFPGPYTKFCCINVVPTSQDFPSAMLLIVRCHSYIEFIPSFVQNGQQTCELEWGDIKDKAILKLLCVCVFRKECKVQIHSGATK